MVQLTGIGLGTGVLCLLLAAVAPSALKVLLAVVGSLLVALSWENKGLQEESNRLSMIQGKGSNTAPPPPAKKTTKQ